MTVVSAEITAHYVDGPGEAGRLGRSAHGRLEFLRTKELLRSVLPTAPSMVLDVGGATGVHAAWLAADGHTVHLIDVVPAHVATASLLPGVTASVGDARALSAADGSADAILLLGPLYHLTDAADRATALAEARRVLRPGGVLAAGAISRYLSLLETGTTGQFTESRTASIRAVVADGTYDGHVGFMPAHFHTSGELAGEMTGAGFTDVTVYGVEGPAWPALDMAGERFEELAPSALRCARLVQTDPLMINASAHLLAIARR
jgi:SAM-dependent methyltransferase